MTRFEPTFRFHRSALALALCTVFVALQAQAQTAETTVSVGLGAVDGARADRAQFGQYNGLHTASSVVGTLGIEYSLRDQDNANWIQLLGSDLLGNTRELSVVWKKPGSWKLSADYGELTRYEPNTIQTGVLGAGTTTPQVVVLGGGAAADVDLHTKRTALGVGFTQVLSPTLQWEASLKREDKSGARLSGIGMNCPSLIAPGCLGTVGANTAWATLLLPEPIHASHTQAEARLSYAIDQFRVSLGYYGSFYRNGNATLNASVPGSLNNPVGSLLPLNTGLQSLLSQPVALPPDNQAHQIDLSGSYDFTRSTRATFKLGYTTATQNADFAAAGLTGAPAGVANLGGEVNTTVAKLGLTSRPLPKLSLLADLRYEDRDDRTPIAAYNMEAASVFTNRSLPNRKTKGKLLAAWQFTSDYRGSVSADTESIDRGVFTPTATATGISALRQKTDESTFTAELRRRMSTDLSGALSVSSSSRTGSNWLKPNSATGVTEISNPADLANGLLPTSTYLPTLADRKRDKAKLYADWQASETLSLQVSAEQGTDKFNVPSHYGLRSTAMSLYSVDAAYALTDNWALSGFASQGVQTLHQARPAGSLLTFDNFSTVVGLGVNGKVSGQLVVGGLLSYTDDKSIYAQTLDSYAGADSSALLAATGGLPNTTFRQTSLKLFGRYEVKKGSAVRVDLVHQRTSLSDWTWGYNGVAYTYSDGTTVAQKPNQSVSVLGVTYILQLP